MNFAIDAINPMMVFSKDGDVVTRLESYDSMAMIGMSEFCPAHSDATSQSPLQIVGPFSFIMNDIDYVSHRDLANGPFNIYGTNIIGKVISMQGQATGDFTAASKSTISGHKTKWAIDLNDGQVWIALAATVIGAIMADPVQAENDFDLDAFMSGLVNGLRGDSFTLDFDVATEKTEVEYMIGDDGAQGQFNIAYGSDVSLKMNDKHISFESVANGLVFFLGTLNPNMRSPFPIPEKIDAGIKQVYTAFDLPLAPIGQEATANTSFALRDVTVSDEIWNLFDPNENLVRDPITFELAMGANGVFKAAHIDYLDMIVENLARINADPTYTPPLPDIDITHFCDHRPKGIGGRNICGGLAFS